MSQPSHALEKRRRHVESVTHGQLKKNKKKKNDRFTPRRTVGPSMLPPSEKSGQSQDSDSDYGPAIPLASQSANVSISPTIDRDNLSNELGFHASASISETRALGESASQRDAWMTVPPAAGPLSQIDPLRKPKGFATGPAAAAKSSCQSRGRADAVWTETANEKRKRLADKVLGITTTEGHASRGLGQQQRFGPETAQQSQKQRLKEEALALKIKRGRGPSLLQVHLDNVGDDDSKKKGPKRSKRNDSNEHAKDDDDNPKKRAFNWEKDMKVGTTGFQDKEGLLNQGAAFSSKFSGGGFL